MGWYAYDISTSPKEEMDRILTWEEKEESTGELLSSNKVLRSCMKGMTYYAAVERYDKGKDSRVIAAVALVNYSPKAKYGKANFAYKLMSEDMGPCRYECPETILDLLTPTDNEYALSWRNLNRDQIKLRKEKVKKLKKVKEGQKIRFESMYNYSIGIKTGDIVTLIKRGSDYYYSIYRWKKSQIPYNFEIVA